MPYPDQVARAQTTPETGLDPETNKSSVPETIANAHTYRATTDSQGAIAAGGQPLQFAGGGGSSYVMNRYTNIDGIAENGGDDDSAYYDTTTGSSEIGVGNVVVSLWMQFSSDSDGRITYFFKNGQSSRINLQRRSSNGAMRYTVVDTAGTNLSGANKEGAGSYSSATGLLNFLFSASIAGNRQQCYVTPYQGAEFADLEEALDTTGNGQIAYTPDRTNLFNLTNTFCARFDVWGDFQVYTPAAFLDLTVEANRRLFVSAASEPVDPQVAIGTLGSPRILVGTTGQADVRAGVNAGTEVDWSGGEVFNSTGFVQL